MFRKKEIDRRKNNNDKNMSQKESTEERTQKEEENALNQNAFYVIKSGILRSKFVRIWFHPFYC